MVSVSDTKPLVGENVKFSWKGSYDPDGDSLSSVRVRVCDSDGNEELVGGSSKYFVGMGDSCVYLKFDTIGKYTIRIEIGDANNNWSNWHTSTVEVREALVLKDVKLTSDDYGIDEGFKWGDYAKSIEYANEGRYSPEEIFSMITVDRKPACFANKDYLGVNWTVSGYVVTESGLPAVNEKVKIVVPMPEQPFEKEILTDSRGYFSYTSNKISWYKIWRDEDTIIGWPAGISSDWCVYGSKNTTTWFYDTYLSVYCDHSEKFFGILATTGSDLEAVLGNKWARNKYNEWGPYKQ